MKTTISKSRFSLFHIALSKLNMTVLFAIIIFINICQIMGIGYPALTVLCMVAILAVFSVITLFCKKKRSIIAIVILSLFNVGAICIFSFVLCNRYLPYWADISSYNFSILFFILLSILIISLGLLLLLEFQEKLIDKSFDKKNILLFAGYLFLVIILNLNWQHAWPQYDNYTYINELNKINFLSLFKVDGLLICGHIADAYSIFYLLFKPLPFNFIDTAYFYNIVLMLFSLLFFDAILRKLIQNQKELFYILSTIMLGISPLMLGSIYIVCPEKILLLGFLLYLQGYLCDKRFNQLLGAFLICTSKETGIVLVAICTMIELCINITTFIKGKDEHTLINNALYYIFLFCLGIIWVTRIMSYAWMSGSAINNERISNDGFNWNSFAVSFPQAVCVLKAIFLTNFTWIPALLLLLAAIKLSINFARKKTSRQYIKDLMRKYLIILTFVLFYVFSLCIYITGCRWRYYTPICVFIYLLGLVGLNYIFRDLKFKNIITCSCIGIVTILLFVQSYITIDPVMLRMFHTLNTGDSQIVALDQNCTWLYNQTCNTATEYNQQIHTFTKTLDKALAKIMNPDDSLCVLFSNEHKIAEQNGAITSIWGLGYEYVSPPRWTHWDYDNERRFLSEEETDRMHVYYINSGEDIRYYSDEYDLVYYIEMPWADSIIHDYQRAVLFDTVTHMGWELKIYKING